MIITSLYSVFVTNQMDELLRRFEKTGSLRIKHHFETAAFDYYVMNDSCGNASDFIQFKNEDQGEHFYALRMNVNDFDKMADMLISKGYVLKGQIQENEHNRHAIFLSTTEPNVILFQHKK